ETLPAASIVRSWTVVVPSPVTTADAPGTDADHVVPPLVDVRYSYPARPEPPLSVPPVAVIDTEASACQEVEPPATVGTVGIVRSMRSVACTQFERSPSASTARNCTRVWPSAETAFEAPGVADDHVVPPSVDVRSS